MSWNIAALIFSELRVPWKNVGIFFRLKLTHFWQQLKQIINLVWFRMRKSQSDRGKKWNLISSFSHSGSVVFAAAARASLMWHIGENSVPAMRDSYQCCKHKLILVEISGKKRTTTMCSWVDRFSSVKQLFRRHSQYIRNVYKKECAHEMKSMHIVSIDGERRFKYVFVRFAIIALFFLLFSALSDRDGMCIIKSNAIFLMISIKINGGWGFHTFWA